MPKYEAVAAAARRASSEGEPAKTNGRVSGPAAGVEERRGQLVQLGAQRQPLQAQLQRRAQLLTLAHRDEWQGSSQPRA
jgi:hypothetical protein